MRKISFLLLFLCLICMVVSAQERSTYLWPIKGERAGSNILYTPQSYIGQEQNKYSMFVEAPEGTVVVSPVTGVVESLFVNYLLSITTNSGSICKTSFDDLIAQFRAEPDPKRDMKYMCGSITIRAEDGSKITINGLSGKQVFKTGQKIMRGEPIGLVSYSYKAIVQPSIEISISKNTIPTDPMAPFGLKTSFVPDKKIEAINSFTPSQVREDFMTCIGVIRECYPGLQELVSNKELDRYVKTTLERIDKSRENWSYIELEYLITQTFALVHDCHISFHGPQWGLKISMPEFSAIDFGWVNDTLVCTNTTTEYAKLVERPIRSINGISADELKRRRLAVITGYDGKVESVIDIKLILENHALLLDRKSGKFDFNMKLEMADNGEVVDLKPVPRNSFSRLYNMAKYMRLNSYKGVGYDMRMINDRTAYLGVSTFSLSQLAIEDIGCFIDSIQSAGVPNLIVDVRNNGGGDINCLTKLYSYIAGSPMKLDGYLKVNRQGGYRTFERSLNRTGAVADSLFRNFSAQAGREGYYMNDTEWNYTEPDPKINYRGRLYVLVNENSWSAATLFPALVVRNHRGVVVGRETPTAYHFMNAQKFVDIRLPNSTLTYTIPLVFCCFDSVVNARVPYGRGVLPDYEVPLSLVELGFFRGDVILNRTLELIEKGEYFKGENPFASAK